MSEKSLKSEVKKQCVFGCDFRGFFLRFGLRKCSPNRAFLVFLSKTPILQKSLFCLSEIAIFQDFGLKKSSQNRYQNAFQNNIEKKGSNIGFRPPFWPRKTSKIASKSDAKRRLFRDAMETAPDSAQINGRHSLLSVHMATHMIRSSPSIDLPLVALIIEVNFST